MSLTTHPSTLTSRPVFSVEAPSLADLVATLRVPSRHFVLLLAADTRGIPGPELVADAEALVRAGASYVCCWGPDATRLEDCFDEADIAVHGDDAAGAVITTAHTDESLEDALLFALRDSTPDVAYASSTGAVVAAAIAAPEWTRRVRDFLGPRPKRDDA